MDQIDEIIKVLIRAKNCDKALNKLKMASENLIFREKENLNEYELRYEYELRCLRHVHSLIKEAIEIIEGSVEHG